MFDRKTYMKKYRIDHKNEIADYKRWWNVEHKIKKNEYDKQYRVEHRVEIAEYRKQRRQTYPLFRVWDGMKQRCYNPNATKYKRYGGRGIVICNEWLNYETFETWALTSGYKNGLTIDRIDNDGNYSPENCQIITKEENARRRWL